MRQLSRAVIFDYNKQTLPPAFFCCIVFIVRACSSADRAFASGAKGRGFDPLHAHKRAVFKGFPEGGIFAHKPGPKPSQTAERCVAYARYSLQAQSVLIPVVKIHVIGQHFIRRDFRAVHIADHLVQIPHQVAAPVSVRAITEFPVRKEQHLVHR